MAAEWTLPELPILAWVRWDGRIYWRMKDSGSGIGRPRARQILAEHGLVFGAVELEIATLIRPMPDHPA